MRRTAATDYGSTYPSSWNYSFLILVASPEERRSAAQHFGGMYGLHRPGRAKVRSLAKPCILLAGLAHQVGAAKNPHATRPEDR
jgi:hypothetical protein